MRRARARAAEGRAEGLVRLDARAPVWRRYRTVHDGSDVAAGAGDARAKSLASPRFFVLRRRSRPVRERLEERQLGAVSEPLDLEDARVSSTRDLDVLAERPMPDRPR